MFPSESKIAILPKYEIHLACDSTILFDNKGFQDFIKQKIEELFWALGIEGNVDKQCEMVLRDKKWLVD